MRTLLLLWLCLVVPGAAQGRVAILTDRDGPAIVQALREVGLEASLVRPGDQIPEGTVLLSLGDTARTALATPADKVLLEPDLDPDAANSSGQLLLLPRTGREETCQKLFQATPGSQVKPVPNGAAGLLVRDDPAQKAVRRFAWAHAGVKPAGLAGVPFLPSPNWDVRNADGAIDTVVVHATVINTLKGTEQAFLDDKVRRVSAHYVVDRDGTIVQMVDERCAAWHAGVSELDGRAGVNAFSVGVELVNLNDGQDPYPQAQVAALARIIRDLRTRWTIPNERIVSHAQVARPVGRKTDPMGFDFATLYRLLDQRGSHR